MTANETITAALRRLGILEGEETMSSAELSDGLGTLNRMLHGFASHGIHYAHTDLISTDPLNFPLDQERNVMLQLCWELADEYDVTISEKLAADIRAGREALQSYYRYIPARPNTRGTAEDIIYQAKNWLGVLTKTPPQHADTIDALDILNQTLFGFNAVGIQYAHATVEATTKLNFPDEHTRNVMLLLAEQLAGEYEVDLSVQKLNAIENARRALQAHFALVPEGSIDLILLPNRARFSMTRG